MQIFVNSVEKLNSPVYSAPPYITQWCTGPVCVHASYTYGALAQFFDAESFKRRRNRRWTVDICSYHRRIEFNRYSCNQRSNMSHTPAVLCISCTAVQLYRSEVYKHAFLD